MPAYHIVLLKLKPGVTAAQINAFATAAKAMVGQVPGLTRIDVGPPMQITAHRSQGFNLGLMALLDAPEDVPKYGAHPAHTRVNELRLEMAEDTLAFDMEY